jgi:hypothetical protein
MTEGRDVEGRESRGGPKRRRRQEKVKVKERRKSGP